MSEQQLSRYVNILVTKTLLVSNKEY